MVRKLGLQKRIKRRQKIKERALYIRLPHKIKVKEEVAQYFTGNFKVELLRQSSRYCYVIFSSVEEKEKNLEAVRNLRVNGKRIVIEPAIIKSRVTVKPGIRKKLVMPKIKPDVKITRTLFMSSIKCGTKLQELRAAIPGCKSIKMLKPYSQNYRGAMVKMESSLIAAEYLTKVRPWPVVGGIELRVKADTRTRVRKRKSDAPLKIYDGDKEVSVVFRERKNDQALDHIVLENKG